MDPKKLRKIEDDLLRQEKYIRRALSQARTLLIIALFPVVLWCLAWIGLAISFPGAPNPPASLAPPMSPYFLPKFGAADAVEAIFTLLFFALWQECRLKLRHIETIKKLREMERTPQ